MHPYIACVAVVLVGVAGHPWFLAAGMLSARVLIDGPVLLYNCCVQYVKLVRKLRAYAGTSFRPCVSDYPEADTLTKVTVSLKNLSLQACDKDGVASVSKHCLAVY